MTAAVNLPPAARVGGKLGCAPDANVSAGLELGMLMRDLEHDRFDHRAGKAVLRVLGLPGRQVDRGPVFYGPVDLPEQREIDVERVGDTPCPEFDAPRAGRLAGPTFQHQFARGRVLARLLARERVHLDRLLPVRPRFVERHPVGQALEIRFVEMHLELIARLMVGAPLYMDPRNVRVDVHDEHCALVP